VLKETQFRLLSESALDGAVNMARDEALMVRVGRGESRPTLRLYQWKEPTISLGYFQPFAQFEALPAPYNKLAVVRRLTGGGAILHDLELTYSITVAAGHPLIADGANRLYEHAHDAVIAALGALGVDAARCGTSDESGAARGPFYCFARRHCYDVVVGADKIAGSAQRRTRAAVLQHGSIVLANRFTDQPTATVPMPFEEAIARMRAAFPDQFARVCGLGFEPGEWTGDELNAGRELAGKYVGVAWTRRT
jgi:lipoate-protein ligase A